jgi:hypothetical protein
LQKQKEKSSEGCVCYIDDKKDKILEDRTPCKNKRLWFLHNKLRLMFKKIIHQPKDSNLVKYFGLDLL